MANLLRRLVSRISKSWRGASHPDIGLLFDAKWYHGRYPDVAERHASEHYFDHGAAEGRDPNPLFDTRWYLAQYLDVAASGANPLAHYLASGAAEGRQPHPLFDARWYRNRYMGGANADLNPLVHYLTIGAAEGHQPHPLFEPRWYLARYPDAASSGMAPLLHFLTQGLAERYSPNPLFDTDWYLTQYPDVVRAGLDPLTHYLRFGALEGRDPSLDFDTKWYRAQNKEALKDGLNPLVHYLTIGRDEGRAAYPYAARRRNDAMRALSSNLEGLSAIEPELRAWTDPKRVRHLPAFSGLVSGQRYRAWHKLFHSLPRAYEQMIFVPSLRTGPFIPLAMRARDAAIETTGGGCLLVATDEAAEGDSATLPGNVDVRNLRQIEPDLGPEDRAAIVRLLVYHVQPRIAINAGSHAWWDVVQQSGAALSINTELQAAIAMREDERPVRERHHELRYLRTCLHHVSKLYFEDARARDQLAAEYGIPSYAQAGFVVLDHPSLADEPAHD